MRETKEGYFTRKLHDMEIGDQQKFDLEMVGLFVTRIPGGWLMNYMEDDSDHFFVPLSSEGEQSAMKGRNINK